MTERKSKGIHTCDNCGHDMLLDPVTDAPKHTRMLKGVRQVSTFCHAIITNRTRYSIAARRPCGCVMPREKKGE